MIKATNITNLRKTLKDTLDEVASGVMYVIQRPKGENVYIISESKYRTLKEKADANN